MPTLLARVMNIRSPLSWLFLGCFTLAMTLSAARAEDAPKAKGAAKKKVSPARLDPFGRPEGSIIDQTARFYVWYDDKGWHVRTTAKAGRDFQGTLKVKDAKIKSCLSIGLTEGKQKGRIDQWKVNGARDELTFQFTTGNKSDGFDFVVEGEDGQIEFDLSIAGKKNPKAVFIGRGLQHPQEDPFSLPATPKKAQ